jgi:hypothetical protein
MYKLHGSMQEIFCMHVVARCLHETCMLHSSREGKVKRGEGEGLKGRERRRNEEGKVKEGEGED